jgi:Asp-tRNA(Asn)/Glu-tRNA(Gln) amidotransferase B subunit
MIKPVYFGKGKDDILLFDYINGLDNFNFSDWVKEKIKEKINGNESEMKDTNIKIKDIETLIRMILKEDKNNIEIEKDNVEDDVIETKENISLDGWTL